MWIQKDSIKKEINWNEVLDWVVIDVVCKQYQIAYFCSQKFRFDVADTGGCQKRLFQRIRNDGVCIRFVVYDVLTDSFSSKEANNHTKWLKYQLIR